jgi:hypothetical protein
MAASTRGQWFRQTARQTETGTAETDRKGYENDAWGGGLSDAGFRDRARKTQDRGAGGRWGARTTTEKGECLRYTDRGQTDKFERVDD